MAYSKYYPNGWKSGEVGATPITPEALNNMENGIAAAVRTEDVANNLTTTAAGKVLDARQGKALSEAIQQSTAWVSETLATYSYGTLVGLKNTAIRMAFVRWSGNANAAPTTSINVQLPDAYKAKQSALSPMFHGNYIEVNNVGNCALAFGSDGLTWTAASVCYPTTT